jgi:hypothetical protein
MKKALSIVVLFFIISSMCVLPARANSMQTNWSGVDSSGTVILDESCPIEVTKELLTFNIEQTPTTSGNSVTGFDVSKSTVTAEYTFYNPSDLEITARLAFPFGTRPGYASDEGSFSITLNGEEIEKEIRYTLPVGRGFDLEGDAARLSDEYLSLGFFSPDMTVTKYTYRTVDEKNLGYNKLIAFDYSANSEGSRIYFPDSYAVDKGNGNIRIGIHNDLLGNVDVYVIGEPLEDPLSWSFYSDKSFDDGKKLDINAEMKLIRTEEMDLESFVLSMRPHTSTVNDVDWYNAVVCGFDYKEDYSVLSHAYGNNISSYLMSWYQYDITIAPGASAVNAVTAPMYPDVNTHPDEPEFEYTYFLSPASTWASFGELEIRINTPYYLTDSSIEGFRKCEGGYTLVLKGLPDEELEFTLSEKSSIVREIKSSVAFLAGVPDEYIYLGTAAIAILGVAIIVILIKKRI